MIVPARYEHVGYLVKDPLPPPPGDDRTVRIVFGRPMLTRPPDAWRPTLVKVYRCGTCFCVLAEDRQLMKDSTPRYPEYYRKRHDEWHRKLVTGR